MKTKNSVYPILLAIVLCLTLFLTLNAFTISGIFNKDTVKKAVSNENFVKQLVLETTGGLTTTAGEDAIVLDDDADTSRYFEILENRKKFGIVTDDVIVSGLYTNTVSEKFAEVSLSAAKSKIFKKSFTPLTEQDVSSLCSSLNKELENFDKNILAENVSENLSLDFKHNPSNLANETNNYLLEAFESATQINGFMAFGYNLPVVWLIVSVLICIVIVLLTVNNKLGFAYSGVSLLISSLILIVSKSKYISLFGSNKFVKSAATVIVNNTVKTVTVVSAIIGIVLIAVSVFLAINDFNNRKKRRQRQQTKRS